MAHHLQLASVKKVERNRSGSNQLWCFRTSRGLGSSLHESKTASKALDSERIGSQALSSYGYGASTSITRASQQLRWYSCSAHLSRSKRGKHGVQSGAGRAWSVLVLHPSKLEAREFAFHASIGLNQRQSLDWSQRRVNKQMPAASPVEFASKRGLCDVVDVPTSQVLANGNMSGGVTVHACLHSVSVGPSVAPRHRHALPLPSSGCLPKVRIALIKLCIKLDISVDIKLTYAGDISHFWKAPSQMEFKRTSTQERRGQQASALDHESA